MANSLEVGNSLEGIETLRKLVNLSRNTRESVFDGLSVDECVNVLFACYSSPWDITPDYLTAEEQEYAADTACLSPNCLQRLTVELG